MGNYRHHQPLDPDRGYGMALRVFAHQTRAQRVRLAGAICTCFVLTLWLLHSTGYWCSGCWYSFEKQAEQKEKQEAKNEGKDPEKEKSLGVGGVYGARKTASRKTRRKRLAEQFAQEDSGGDHFGEDPSGIALQPMGRSQRSWTASSLAKGGSITRTAKSSRTDDIFLLPRRKQHQPPASAVPARARSTAPSPLPLTHPIDNLSDTEIKEEDRQ